MSEQSGLTEVEVDQINDAFVEANRAEFLDTDFDLPIQRAIEFLVVERMRVAWHEGYGAGSSNATDGWLDHRSPVTQNPYTRPIPPGSPTHESEEPVVIDPPIPPWCFEHQAYNCPHSRGEIPVGPNQHTRGRCLCGQTHTMEDFL